MKKLFLPMVAAIFALTLVACKKDYQCSCDFKFGGTLDTTLVFTYTDVKKSDAEDGCSNAETQYKTVDPQASCSLK